MMKKINGIKKVLMIFWITALIIFIISILGQYVVLNFTDIVHVIDTNAPSSTKILSKEISLFLTVNNILKKIGFVFLALGLICTGVSMYQKHDDIK